MKLTYKYFFPTVTNEGAQELYNFADSIIYKRCLSMPRQQHEDIRQEIVLYILSNLHKYDSSRGVPLGGWAWLYGLGAVSLWANRHKREIACDDMDIKLIKAGLSPKFDKDIDNLS